jgi:glycosyltransferase involved in cell wall biosynthesis
MGQTHELKYSRGEIPIIKYRLCHIGGMSIHKGYQLLRQAVYHLPKSLPIQFTVIDHRLASSINNYQSAWNGYHVDFIAPIPMNEMPKFYCEQDVLLAPSIWPESFGLVTREAVSAGLWVIASDAGALAEPILKTEEDNGTVIRPNNLEDLVKALEDLPIVLNNNKADDRN